MKIIWRNTIIVVLFLGGLPVFLFGQPATNKYEFGANFGFFVYQGDLTPATLGSFRTQKPGFNIFVNRILNNSFSLRTNLALGKLKGDDGKYSSPAFRQQRNFNFASPVFEISESVAWNPLGKNENDKGISPYLMGGVGYSFLLIKRDWSRFNSEYFDTPEVLNGLVADQQHSLPAGMADVPVGIGIRYFLSPRLSISAEASYRFTFTDYLDGFSKAANPAKRDHYSSYSLGLVYKAGNKNKLNCPVIRN